MSESNQSEIERLLKEGLDHYGAGEMSEAFRAWKAVVELDPHNVEALDYLESADRRSQRQLPPSERLSDVSRRIVFEARTLLGRRDFEGTFDLLCGAAESGRANLEMEATLELVRGRLLRQYRQRVGDLGSVPRLRKDPGDVAKFNLPADAGFMLSMMDGATSLADLISLSGMDAFGAMRIVQQLLDAEIVGFSP
jgi:hypothetical protein